MLSSVVVVWVYIEDRLVVVAVVDRDRFRLWPFIEPLKKSPMEDPGRLLKRFREIASRPKIDAFERCVGVEGREIFPVLNSNNPN